MRTIIPLLLTAVALLVPPARAETTPPTETPGSVEGHMVLHGKPLPGATIIVLRQLVESHVPAQTAITDAKGHFRVDNVPPGEYAVGLEVELNTKSTQGSSRGSTESYRRHIIVGPGEHVLVPPYPKGNTLKGRMVLAPGSTYDVAWQGEDLRHIYTPRKHPKHDPRLSPEEHKKKWEAYRKTKKFRKEWVKGTRIVVDVHPDGTFHAFDVPPGDYVLTIDVGTNTDRPSGTPPAVAYTTFTMPNTNFTLPDIQVHEPQKQ